MITLINKVDTEYPLIKEQIKNENQMNKLKSIILNELTIHNNLDNIKSKLDIKSAEINNKINKKKESASNVFNSTSNNNKLEEISNNNKLEDNDVNVIYNKLQPKKNFFFNRSEDKKEKFDKIIGFINNNKSESNLIEILLNHYHTNYSNLTNEINLFKGIQDRHLYVNFNKNDIKNINTISHDDNNQSYRPIRNFQLMFNQVGDFHKKHDTNPCLNKFGLFNHVCEDTYLIFLLFVKHISFYYLKNTQEQKEYKIKIILEELLYYLNNTIFLIDDNCLDKLTNETPEYQHLDKFICNDNIGVLSQLSFKNQVFSRNNTDNSKASTVTRPFE